MRRLPHPFTTLMSLLTCLLLLVSCGSGEVQIKIDSEKADNSGYTALPTRYRVAEHALTRSPSPRQGRLLPTPSIETLSTERTSSWETLSSTIH